MKDKVTVSLKPEDRALIDEIIASVPTVDSHEKALLWSLRAAKTLLQIDAEIRNIYRPQPRIFDVPYGKPGLDRSPYDVIGLPPGPGSELIEEPDLDLDRPPTILPCEPPEGLIEP